MSKRRMAMERLLSGAGEATQDATPTPVRAGAVKTMGLALLDMEDGARAGERVIDIAADAIDPSFVRDRLDETDVSEGGPTADGAAMEGLVRSIEEGGQLVPILVRPHPAHPNRYQIAYGHRRWRACARLGRPVRAMVRDLTDEALLLAQGRENNAREDLTFIERAQFATALLERGMTRAMVGAALGVDKSELTRFLAVANGLPDGLAARIGRAPKAGRPRWMKLLGLVHEHGAEAAFATLNAIAEADSDRRFKGLITALERRSGERVTGDRRERYSAGPVAVARRGQRVSITIDERHAPGLARFVEDRLATLLAEYQRVSETVPAGDSSARIRTV